MCDSLVLNCNHNGINCIQKTDAERPCDKIWFTAKQIEEALGVNKRTLNRHIETLESTGDLRNGGHPVEAFKAVYPEVTIR